MQTAEAKTIPAKSAQQAFDESIYRQGFEAAFDPETFEHAYEDVILYLQTHYVDIYDSESFRQGYQCGQDYAETLQER